MLFSIHCHRFRHIFTVILKQLSTHLRSLRPKNRSEMYRISYTARVLVVRLLECTKNVRVHYLSIHIGKSGLSDSLMKRNKEKDYLAIDVGV